VEQNTTYVAFDTSKETIAVALAEGGRRGEVRFFGTIANRPEAVRKLVDKLAGRHPRLAFCYEDGVIPARRFRFRSTRRILRRDVHRRIHRRTRHVLHRHRCFDEGERTLHRGRKRQNRARD
jgi:hypothetical protein